MLRHALLGLLALLAGLCLAQRRNAHWPLSPQSWLHFDWNGLSTGLLSASTTFQIQSAAISSPNGQLLLYANGCAVFDRVGNEILSRFPDSMGSCAGTQGWVFLPWPEDNDRVIGLSVRYYNGEAEWFGRQPLCTYTFDMTLNGGLGAVQPASFRVLRMDSVSYRLTAVPHGNGTDYWALVHQHSSDAFLAYRITAAGVDSVPVISHTGEVLPMETSYTSVNGAVGHLVTSPDGTRLAMIVMHLGDTERVMDIAFYHFDPNTGMVEHEAKLPQFPLTTYASAEFSPDGSKFYLLRSTLVAPSDLGSPAVIADTLFQFDLSNMDPMLIAQSAYVVESDTSYGGHYWGIGPPLTLNSAPDGRIYALIGRSPYLSTIHNPNAPGAACGFVRDDVVLPDTVNALPNLCKSYHDSQISADVPGTPTPMQALEVWPIPCRDHVWLRAEQGGTVALYSALAQPLNALGLRARQLRSMDITGLAPGAYVLRFNPENGEPTTRRIIKE